MNRWICQGDHGNYLHQEPDRPLVLEDAIDLGQFWVEQVNDPAF